MIQPFFVRGNYPIKNPTLQRNLSSFKTLNDAYQTILENIGNSSQFYSKKFANFNIIHLTWLPGEKLGIFLEKYKYFTKILPEKLPVDFAKALLTIKIGEIALNDNVLDVTGSSLDEYCDKLIKEFKFDYGSYQRKRKHNETGRKCYHCGRKGHRLKIVQIKKNYSSTKESPKKREDSESPEYRRRESSGGS